MRSPVNVRGTVDSMEVLLQEDSDSTLEINRTASRATIVPSMVLSWHDITVTEMNSGKSSKIFSCCTENEDVEKKRGNHKRRILDEAFGVAQPGEVVAILGPSGSGKTTLLNVITKRNTGQLDVQGSVKQKNLVHPYN
ncbi:unnamed protein product [Caenorhabditis auriculariae]|uniref:ABC transporter domain-containing protein n=1 Tax=Caenorhabditis auriculariae TaxID=2777116 RepID=A0A8S1H4X9_9PELO|nr:unnamed protein product [Caenorhabditis auriculariae]